MLEKKEFDLWADENEPLIYKSHTVYGLRMPHPAEYKTAEQPFVYVEVDEYGGLSLDRRRTMWFGNRIDGEYSKSVWEFEKEIYDWLCEWEFARWINIGPEDREIFALKKLTGEDYEYERY